MAEPSLAPNLSYLPVFDASKEDLVAAWRHVVGTAVELGIPIPAFMNALAYYDGYRSERLPANLLQAQRDYFGAHTYERLDKPGSFHTEWIELRKKPE